MKRTLTALILIAPLLLTGSSFAQDGHAGHNHAAQAKESAAPKAEKPKKAKAGKAVLRKVTAEEAGKKAACPVTGEEITVSTETVSALYKGATYYFCCPGCDKSFMANPEKYAKKAVSEVKKIYICPMGDYSGDKPGKCPKCGMKLEEKK